MSNLEIYNQRFTESGRRVFVRALNGVRSRGQNYVVVEHFIEALCAEEARLFRLLAGLLKIDLDQVQTMMAKRLENFPQPWRRRANHFYQEERCSGPSGS
jgi:ATP-dependent Clp protease ATP-binding subunit ClpA